VGTGAGVVVETLADCAVVSNDSGGRYTTAEAPMFSFRVTVPDDTPWKMSLKTLRVKSLVVAAPFTATTTVPVRSEEYGMRIVLMAPEDSFLNS
jgi:hypothetical protein